MSKHIFDEELEQSGMDILNFMASKFKPMMGFRKMPHIICEDGFTVSVQCGEALYCTPRNNIGPYRKFEIGFPSKDDDLIKPYRECDESEIYPQTDLYVILALIDKHGGLSEEFKNNFYEKLKIRSEGFTVLSFSEEKYELPKITFG